MSVPSINGMMQPSTATSNLVRQPGSSADPSKAGSASDPSKAGPAADLSKTGLEKTGQVSAQSKADDKGAVDGVTDPTKVKDAAKSVEDFIKSHSNTQVEFSLDKETNMSVVKVVDISTKEVITQIPSKEVIAMAQAIDKLQGLMSMKGVLLPSRTA